MRVDIQRETEGSGEVTREQSDKRCKQKTKQLMAMDSDKSERREEVEEIFARDTNPSSEVLGPVRDPGGRVLPEGMGLAARLVCKGSPALRGGGSVCC